MSSACPAKSPSVRVLAVDGLEGDVGGEGHSELWIDLVGSSPPGAKREAFYLFSLIVSNGDCAKNIFLTLAVLNLGWTYENLRLGPRSGACFRCPLLGG